MARNVFLATILVFLIVVDVSDAAFLEQIRKLVAPSPKEVPNINASPVPSPVTNEKQSSSVGDEKKGKDKQNQPTPPSNAGKDKPKPKVDQATDNPAPAPVIDTKKENNTPKEEVKEKGGGKSNLPQGTKENCSGVHLNCHDTKSMLACVKRFDDASKTWTLIIQNEGNSSIKVDLTILPYVNKKRQIDVSEHQTEMVNVSLPSGGGHKIRLNAGNGDCMLDIGPTGAPASQGNFFQQLPSYSKFMTPVYGAYLSFVIILIAGGMGACCWFGKRKAHSEVAYQELELSMPESAAATAETAEGWDQDWDDGWDEEKAVTSPGAQNISANGLTSRAPAPKKDGWEDWDD